MLKAKLFNSPEKCMTGAELRRLRDANNLSQQEVAERMAYWGWYQKKVNRLEGAGRFCLDPTEMRELLRVLKASSI